jgi:hypothetical protein
MLNLYSVFICKPETVHSYEINLNVFVDYMYVHVYLLSVYC